MSDGATISTGQLIAAFAALFSVIGTCLGLVRHLYETRLADKDKAVVALEKRIEKMESREEERNRASDRYLESLERAVDLLSRQAGVTEEVVRTAVPTRRGRSGD